MVELSRKAKARFWFSLGSLSKTAGLFWGSTKNMKKRTRLAWVERGRGFGHLHLKGNRTEKATRALPIGIDFCLLFRYTQLCFTQFLVVFAKDWRLKVAKTRPWVPPYCTSSLYQWRHQQSGMCGKSIKYVTSKPFSAFHWYRLYLWQFKKQNKKEYCGILLVMLWQYIAHSLQTKQNY